MFGKVLHSERLGADVRLVGSELLAVRAELDGAVDVLVSRITVVETDLRVSVAVEVEDSTVNRKGLAGLDIKMFED